MPDFRIRQTSVPALSEGVAESARLNRRGEVVTSPYFVQLALEGRLFLAQLGDLTTGVATNVNLTPDEDQPEFLLRVPSGTTAVPMYVCVRYEVTAADDEGIMSFCNNDVGNGTSSAPSLGPINLRTDRATVQPACVARQIATANVTAPTNRVDLWRFGSTAATDIDANTANTGIFEWSALHQIAPALVGPASLLLYVTGGTTAPTIFITLVWAEAPSSEMI